MMFFRFLLDFKIIKKIEKGIFYWYFGLVQFNLNKIE